MITPVPWLAQRWSESRSFWQQLMGRDGPEPGPILLNRRRVYILPTRAGIVFALTLLAMLIGAINYGNSLAFAFTFLLSGVGLLAMVRTFSTLHRLTFRPGRVIPVFAGEQASFPISIENYAGEKRIALELSLGETPSKPVDIPADDALWLDLHRPSQGRGRLTLPRVTVESRFPLGLFRAWGYLHLQVHCLVYPTPAPERGLPRDQAGGVGGTGSQGEGSDDFDTLRAWRPGDSPRHIHWRVVARTGNLLTKQFSGDRSEQLWLEWESLPGLDIERRLSRLCRWVLEADAAGLHYGLLLPGVEIAPNLGDTHRRSCLEALALFGTTP